MLSNIPVLLAEQEPETISVVSLFLAEIKECRLDVVLSTEEALLKISESIPSLFLLAHGLQGMDGLEAMRLIHEKYPSIYVIVALLHKDPDLLSDFMISGANDCIIKDAQYVPNLVVAVKKALIRIAERDAFELPHLSHADQFAVDENLPDIVFHLNSSGKVLYANRAVVDLLGIRQKDIVNHQFEDLILGKEQRKDFRRFLEGTDSNGSFRRMISLRPREGSGRDFEINLSIKEDDLIYGVARQVESQDPQKTPVAAVRKEASDKSQEIPVRIGPYRVMTLLGAGAMGRVYKGFDEQLERYVAIKVVGKRQAGAKDYLERFHREAKLLASIAHPNIALIYYFGELEGLPYFCMEYMPGGSLENQLQLKKVIDSDTAVSYTMQVAIGLGKAIEKGVVHLDIKPSNLMIAENDRIKVVDFGLARTRIELETAPSRIIGTPLYIAPEQIRGGLVDFRCDIYSLGITFFQMLYGFVPHAASSVQEVFRRRMKEGLPAVESLNSSVPVDLYNIVKRMTNSDPAERYVSYADLIEDLEQARRAGTQKVAVIDMVPPEGSAVYMRGILYDRPFPEVLGEIAAKGMSGKLTLSWFDLCKNLHFKNGSIVAVMSNQEGESFVDILLGRHQLSNEKARKLGAASSDLFSNYSSAMSEISAEARKKISIDMEELARRILHGLFSWVVGEFLFEEGNFQGQGQLQIPTMEIIIQGVRGWVDFPTIHRRLHGGECNISLNPDFQKILPSIPVSPADAFILFRFDGSIQFRELLDLSGISEEEFFRVIYLFLCLDIVRIEHVARPHVTPRAKRREVLQGSDQTSVLVPPRVERVTPKPPEKVEALPPQQPAIPLEPERRPGTPDKTNGKDLGLYYYRCAIQSLESKNHWAAVEYCRKALEFRKEARIYRLMGNALATHRAFHHEAMEAYKKAQEKDPGNPVIERDIADLYFLTESYALARARYQNVLQKNPEDKHSIEKLKEIAKLRK